MSDERPNRDPTTDSPAAASSPEQRSSKDRAADHAAIDRLARDLLPALVARLADSGLGEIEVREGSWRVRVRRPATDGGGQARRAVDRASRAQPGHAGHGHQPAGFEGHRSSREPREPRETRAAIAGQTNGASPAGLVPVGPGSDPSAEAALRARDETEDSRTIATSPAVGVYQPRAEARAGTRVRAGDRLGAVDMLGVPQEVVAPIDGIVGASLVERGQAVEYGQELVVIDPAGDEGQNGPPGRSSRET